MFNLDLEAYEKQFSVTVRNQPQALFHTELVSFMEQEGFQPFMETYGSMIKALSSDVVATYFASWVGRVCAAFHYALWHDGVHLDLTLSNLTLHVSQQSGYAVLHFRLKELRGKLVPDSGRETCLKTYLEDYYEWQVRPLFESVAKACGISVGSLWGQLATRLHYYQDAWLKETTDEELRARMLQDFDVLRHELNPEVFGRPHNPLNVHFRMVEDPRTPGTKLRIKATCCLAYKTDNGYGYCPSCPKLTDTEREQLLLSKV